MGKRSGYAGLAIAAVGLTVVAGVLVMATLAWLGA